MKQHKVETFLLGLPLKRVIDRGKVTLVNVLSLVFYKCTV